MKKIKEYKKDVDEYINKKSRIVGDYSPAGSYLKKLIDERSKYENELNSIYISSRNRFREYINS